MTTDRTAIPLTSLERDAAQWLTYLNLQDAFEQKGSTYCSMQRLILKFNPGNGSLEGRERLAAQISALRVAFTKGAE